MNTFKILSLEGIKIAKTNTQYIVTKLIPNEPDNKELSLKAFTVVVFADSHPTMFGILANVITNHQPFPIVAGVHEKVENVNGKYQYIFKPNHIIP
jgi:hypothetical protein